MQLAPPPLFQFFDANGLPLAGGLLFTYEAGTTTPLATYTDVTGVTPNTNPIVLDANGECTVWIGSSAYKFVLQDSLGNVQWTRDGIQYIPDGSITTIMLADGSVTTAKIADDAVTSAKIADGAVGTAEIADDAITAAKIPDASIPTTKLIASTELGFGDLGGARDGAPFTAFPKKPWTAPTAISDPATPLTSDGDCVRWSPNGKMLATAGLTGIDANRLFSRFGATLKSMFPAFYPSLGSGSGSGACWSPDGEYLLFTQSSTDIPALYQRSGNGYAQLNPPLLVTSGYLFTVTPANATAGATYTNNGVTYTVVTTVSGSPTLVATGAGDPLASGTLTKASGTGDSTITFSAFSIIRMMGCDWHPSGDYFAIAHRSPPYISTFSRADIMPNHIEAIYTQVSGQVLASGNNTINFNQIITDNMSAYGFLASFVCPRASTYDVSAIIDIATASSAGSSLSALYIFKNSAPHKVLAQFSAAGNYGGSAGVSCQAGDVLAIVVTNNNTGTLVLSTGVATNMLSIIEAPSFNRLSSFAHLSSPASLPTGDGLSVAWSPDGTLLAVGHATTEYVFTVTSASATVGATYTNNGVTYTVLATVASSLTLSATGAGAPLASGTLTKASGTGDTTITFSAVTVPKFYISVYSFDGTTLTKAADPATFPTGQVNGVAWSPDGTLLTCAHTTTPFMTTYSVSTSSGVVLTAIASPSTLPAGDGNGVAYSHDGTRVAVAHNASPFVTIYDISGTTFTKETNPTALPTGNGKSVSWTPDDQYLTIGHVSSPFMTTLRTSGTYAAGVTFIKEVNLE